MKSASVGAQEYAVLTKGATGSTTAFTSNQSQARTALVGTAKATTAASVGMKALSVAMNIGAMMAFSLAIQGILWVTDQLIITLKEQKEAVENASSAYSNVQSELESVNSELDSQRKLMDDLLAKDNLTYAERDQLKELKDITAELLLQQDITEKNVQNAKKDLALQSAKLVNKQFGTDFVSKSSINEYESNADITGNNAALISDPGDLNATIAGYKQFSELLEQAYSDKNQDNIEHFKDLTSDISNSIWDSVNSLQEQKVNMQDYYNVIKDISYDGLTSEQKNIVDSYKRTSEDIKNAYAELSPEEWNSIQIDTLFNTEGIEKTKEDLVEMAKSGTLTPETLESYTNLNNAIKESDLILEDEQTAVQALCNEMNALADSANKVSENLVITPTLSISSTIDQLNTQLKPTFDSLKSAYQGIFTEDSFTLENVDLSMLDSIKSSLDDMGEKLNIDVDYSEYENLVKVLTNSSSTADEVQQSMNTLVQSVLNNTSVLQNFNGESYKTVQSMLETLGVANSESVMLAALGYSYEEYTAAKVECTDAGFDLANATDVEIAKFIEEQGGADNCGVALANLQLKKILMNSTQITTATDIAQILSLAKAANISSQSLVALAAAKEKFETASANGDKMGMSLAARGLTEIGEKVKNDLLNYEPVAVDFAPTSKKSASKAGKETADAYLEAYKKELAELEYLHNMEKITDKEFYETLRDLNETYFNDTSENHKKYLDEYQSNEEKIAKGLKDVWTKYWEDYKSDLDKVSSYAERVLSKQIDSLKDKQDTEVDGKEKEISAIDDKIKALEKEKDTTEKFYEDQIDVIQGKIDSYNDEINKLREINEEKNRQLQLEKDIYELDRLRNQKTQKEYVDGKGIVYKADSSAIRDQEQTVENDRLEIEIASYKKLIKGLEAQQDSLKEKMDSLIDSIDAQLDKLDAQKDGLQDKIDSINDGYEAQIEALEKYKEKWSEVSDQQAILEEEALARQLLGVDAEQNILDMREGILNDYIGKYQIASDNLSLISDAKLHDISGILAQMQISADTVNLLAGGLGTSLSSFDTTVSAFNDAANTVDTTNVKDSLSSAGGVADTTRKQISDITTELNELASEVSTYALPPINTEQFTASLGTAEGTAGILGQLRTFTDRFREICDLIPTAWRNALNAIPGGDLVGGEGTDYNVLFYPLLSAMDNCKFQMDTKLAEYAAAWMDFNVALGTIIGIDGGGSSNKQNAENTNKSKNDQKQESSVGSASSIVSSIRTGGELINAEFEDTWIPGFKTMGEQVNEICTKIISCVNEMAEKTVDACRKAVDAINKANAAKESSSSSNEKPSKFRGESYTGQAFARGTMALKSNVDDALTGELGAELVVNEKTGQYRFVGRNGAEFTDLNKEDVVFDHEQTKAIVKNSSGPINKNIRDKREMSVVDERGYKLIQELRANPGIRIAENNMAKFVNLPVPTLKMDNLQNLQRQLDNLDNITMKGATPTPVVQEIHLSLPNVTNDSGAQYIIKTLKELPSDTIQYTHRR